MSGIENLQPHGNAAADSAEAVVPAGANAATVHHDDRTLEGSAPSSGPAMVVDGVVPSDPILSATAETVATSPNVPTTVVNLMATGSAFTAQLIEDLLSIGCSPADVGRFLKRRGVSRSDVIRVIVHVPPGVRKGVLEGSKSEPDRAALRNAKAESDVAQDHLLAMLPPEAAPKLQDVLAQVEATKTINMDRLALGPLRRALKVPGLPISTLSRALLSRGARPGEVKKLIYAVLSFWDSDSDMTDAGNARRLALLFGSNIRYCADVGWLIWDGKRWCRDKVGDIYELAKAAAKSWRDDAACIARTATLAADDNERDDILVHARRLSGWASKSESKSKLQAMVKLAETIPGIAITPDQLDTHRWLLNVENGTLDLRTGELRDHDRRDLLTSVSPVHYRPDAQFRLWDEFLDAVTGGDEEFKAYLQRMVGYWLTGVTPEEALFFLFGPGASGKSSFMEAIRAALGAYAKAADFETFLKKSGGGGIPNDIAALRGARMVSASEVDEGRSLAGSLIKAITGGDTILARFLYHEYFEFIPEFKLVFVANDAPGSDGADSGMQRRMRVVPFPYAVPPEARQPTLKTLLTDPTLAGPGILAWAVEGCRMWQRDGLGSAAVVDAASKDYAESMDDVARFIEDCCIVGPNVFVTWADLYGTYKAWALANGETVRSERGLGPQLTKKGFRAGKLGGRRGRKGLGLPPLSNSEQWAERLLSPPYPSTPPALPPGRNAR